MFTESLPNKERLFWFRYSGFRRSCHSILYTIKNTVLCSVTICRLSGEVTASCVGAVSSCGEKSNKQNFGLTVYSAGIYCPLNISLSDQGVYLLYDASEICIARFYLQNTCISRMSTSRGHHHISEKRSNTNNQNFHHQILLFPVQLIPYYSRNVIVTAHVKTNIWILI
jgi:hypothetical protein